MRPDKDNDSVSKDNEIVTLRVTPIEGDVITARVFRRVAKGALSAHDQTKVGRRLFNSYDPERGYAANPFYVGPEGCTEIVIVEEL